MKSNQWKRKIKIKKMKKIQRKILDLIKRMTLKI